MGWKEYSKMDEKLKFIARYLEGEKIALLCRGFGISRVTGHNLIKRYKMMGECALVEQKRTPHHYANKLPIAVEALILNLKREYQTWGAPKIREKIIRRYPDVKTPAISTIHAVLDRHGLVKHRKGRKRYKNNPIEIYKHSLRELKPLEPLYYPFHDQTITVSQCGRICTRGFKVSLSRSFAGQQVGIKEMEDNIWVVSFLDYDLGYFDDKSHRVEPVEDPFGIEKV